MTEQVNLEIVLVHGTWGRGFFPKSLRPGDPPRWFEPGHQYRDCLDRGLRESGFRYRISHHDWSGANSIADRFKAAVKLASILDQRSKADANVIQVVVGHSHGGNIALKAVAYLKAAGRRPQVGIVTLATPFLTVLNVVDATARKFQDTLGWLTTALLLSAVIFMLMDFAPAVGLAHQSWLPFLSGASAGIALPLRAMAFGNQSGNKGYGYYRLNDLMEVPLAVLRAPDDEATLGIIFSAIGTKLSRTMVEVSSPIYSQLCTFGGLTVLGYGLATMGSEPKAGWVVFSQAALVLAGSLGFFVFLMGVLIFIGALFRCANGRELLLGGLSIDVNVHSVPDYAGSIFVLTVPETQRRRSLRHSIYNLSECPRMTLLGIARTLARYGQSGFPERAFDASVPTI